MRACFTVGRVSHRVRIFISDTMDAHAPPRSIFSRMKVVLLLHVQSSSKILATGKLNLVTGKLQLKASIKQHLGTFGALNEYE